MKPSQINKKMYIVTKNEKKYGYSKIMEADEFCFWFNKDDVKEKGTKSYKTYMTLEQAKSENPLSIFCLIKTTITPNNQI